MVGLWLRVLCFVADILKANDEVIRVMALYEDTVHRPDGDSLLIDNAAEEVAHGQYIKPRSVSWQRDVVVTALVISTKLLSVEPC